MRSHTSGVGKEKRSRNMVNASSQLMFYQFIDVNSLVLYQGHLDHEFIRKNFYFSIENYAISSDILGKKTMLFHLTYEEKYGQLIFNWTRSFITKPSAIVVQNKV